MKINSFEYRKFFFLSSRLNRRARELFLQIQMLPGYAASHGSYELNSDKPIHVFSTTQVYQYLHLKYLTSFNTHINTSYAID